MRTPVLLGLIPATFLLNPSASAQLAIDYGTLFYGESVANAGDVDGDGIDDYLAGNPSDWWGGPDSFVRVLSGADGSLIRQHTFPNSEHFGWRASGRGDVNGDGHADYIVAALNDFDDGFGCGCARAYDGLTGAQFYLASPAGNWWHFPSGGWLVELRDGGDGNGDQVPDWISTGQLGGSSWSAAIHSGVNGAKIRTFVDATVQDLGSSATWVGDWDADGADDVAISGASQFGVYSSASGARLSLFNFAGALHSLGDWDGDGSTDILVSDRLALVGTVVSGANGSVLQTMSGYSLYTPGPDYDSDGVNDFIVGHKEWSGSRGRAAILSGATGGLLLTLVEGQNSGDGVGSSLAAMGDGNGDGIPEVVVGARGMAGGGAVMLFNGFGPPAPVNVCTAAVNSTGSGSVLTHSGSWSIANNDFTVVAPDLPANHFGLMYFGPSSIELPFGDGFRCVGGVVNRLWPAISSGPTGTAMRSVDFTTSPADIIAPASTWYFQHWYRDTPAMQSGFNLSDALEVTFVP